MDLTAQWIRTMARTGGAPDPNVGRSLLARYAEPHRHYHTVQHLSAVLSTVDRLAAESTRPDLVRLAAWYHDAIYDPERDDNEEVSARLAEHELASTGLAAGRIAAVAGLVRVTAGHDAPGGDCDAEVLCDADLSVLASAGPAYDAYVAAVRREYQHVDDAGWRHGRAAVLGGLLAAPRLFRTQLGRTWEQAARDNVSRELAALVGPSAGAAPPP